MADSNAARPTLSTPDIGIREFIAMMAALMAAGALSIDAMLPALPAIGESLGVAEDNRRQLVLTSYLIGFGVFQIVYGPLSDRFGRKRLLVLGVGLYAAFALLAAVAKSFDWLLAARALQGAALAATRVLVVSVIRDRCQGAAMARIMSMVMIVFMIVPILAPSFGQAILAIAGWREIFWTFAVYGGLLFLWAALRLPETLPPERRRPLSISKIGEAVAETLRNRQSIGNTLAQTLLMGAIFAFINSVQQIVFDVFGRPELIGLVFGLIAAPMALSSFLNSQLVMRLGARRILLSGLSAFTAMAVIHLLFAELVGETIWSFVILQAGTMIFVGLIGANAGALAMEPLGHIAGTASSIQGVIGTIGGALLGFSIGQQFDGTTLPFQIGFALCGAAALAVAFWANQPPRRDSHDQMQVEVQETATRPG